MRKQIYRKVTCPWVGYASNLDVEFTQSKEEGLDVDAYKELFTQIQKLPPCEERELMADAAFSLILNAPMRPDYPYQEPSTLEEIRALRKPVTLSGKPDPEKLPDQLLGAWLGRVCGCMLGKTVEGIRTDELIPLLQESGNYPMHRYILSTDITEDTLERFRFNLRFPPYADKISCMPADDDTNYLVLAQELIEQFGRDFTPENVSEAWTRWQPRSAYFTAEQVAYCNFVNGYEIPDSAIYKNPFREWIGAQIRGDYFGYINPGNTETAADMAFRDACISHVKNGIYGEMFASAMIAAAAVTTDLEEIILAGLGEIPATSRLYEAIMQILNDYRNGVSQEAAFEKIHAAWDEHTAHGWCHTISNAMIVAAALLYGEGDFGKSICMAVQTGFDTDCNGATVGSVLGIRGGSGCIGKEWTDPIHGLLQTQIQNVGTVSIAERAQMTLKHLV